MRLAKVKWNNHEILGDLELDFVNGMTGKPFETIVFAGENGTGKTTILETLSTFLNLGSITPFEFVDYMIDGEMFRASSSDMTATHSHFFKVTNSAGETFEITSDKNNRFPAVENTRHDLRRFGCVFSKARADYKTQKISHTTLKKIDDDKYDNDQDDDFTALKQLLVDIQFQDTSDYYEDNKRRGENPISVDSYYPKSKTFRFKNAFDGFFPKLKFDKVIDNQDEKSIVFLKNNKTISIDKLSTGEKQIVFRGTYLLRNTGKLTGASIMIDEPELSMHPKWQANILRYYKQLFSQDNQQMVQLFIASHSEYVVEDALLDKTSNLVIVLREDSAVIKSKKIDAPAVLPSITSAETNYLAFDIVSNDYHVELYGYLQSKHSLGSVKACDTHIANDPHFNLPIHTKNSVSPHGTPYVTLSTYIRNAIDHPTPGITFNEAELRTSILLLIELCK